MSEFWQVIHGLVDALALYRVGKADENSPQDDRDFVLQPIAAVGSLGGVADLLEPHPNATDKNKWIFEEHKKNDQIAFLL